MQKSVLGGLIILLASSCSDGAEEVNLAAPFRDCPTCPLMQPITNGSFTMGASEVEAKLFLVNDPWFKPEIPRHEVTFDYSFSVSTYEVSVAEYRDFVISTNRNAASECRGGYDKPPVVAQEEYSWEAPGHDQTDNFPVVCVTWQDAVDYTLWLSHMTGFTYRLPSESEWEYASTAGSETRFFWGNRVSETCGFANVADETAVAYFDWDDISLEDFNLMEEFHCSDGHEMVAPTRRPGIEANPFALFDTIGNVSEIVQDCHFDDHIDAPSDGSARLDGRCLFRVVKGNNWAATPVGARTAARTLFYPTRGDALVGFRILREMEP